MSTQQKRGVFAVMALLFGIAIALLVFDSGAEQAEQIDTSTEKARSADRKTALVIKRLERANRKLDRANEKANAAVEYLNIPVEGRRGPPGPAVLGPIGNTGARGPIGIPGLTVPGTDGSDGSDGSDGRDGLDGPAGPGPTDSQIGTAIAAYCAARDECAGPSGKDGADGIDGGPGPPGPAIVSFSFTFAEQTYYCDDTNGDLMYECVAQGPTP